MSSEPSELNLNRLAHAYNRAIPAFACLLFVEAALLRLSSWHPPEGLSLIFAWLFLMGLYLAAWILNLFTIPSLATALGMSRWVAIASGILFFIPYVGIPYGIALLVWAFVRLRASGVKALPFRVTSAEMDRIALRQCRQCAYPRAGLVLGVPCPECGTVSLGLGPAAPAIPAQVTEVVKWKPGATGSGLGGAS